MNVKDLPNQDDYLRTPQIERSAVKLRWYSEYWDGPLSGMLLYDNQDYWFCCCAHGTESFYRRFMVIQLSDEQLRDEHYWHELFRQKVGSHTDYDEDGENEGVVKPKEAWPEFYDPYKQREAPDLSRNQVIGWFEI